MTSNISLSPANTGTNALSNLSTYLNQTARLQFGWKKVEGVIVQRYSVRNVRGLLSNSDQAKSKPGYCDGRNQGCGVGGKISDSDLSKIS